MFQFLAVPMRIKEKETQYKCLEVLAHSIAPDCIVGQDHIDFVLDLLDENNNPGYETIRLEHGLSILLVARSPHRL